MSSLLRYAYGIVLIVGSIPDSRPYKIALVYRATTLT